MRTLNLLSGGMDSTVCAAMAVGTWGAKNVHAVSIFYGQKHARELSAAGHVADDLGITWQMVEVPPRLFHGGVSPLVNSRKEVPNIPYSEIDGLSPLFVPFRNGILLSAAAAIAFAQGLDLVYFGAHAEDALGWAYPDCSAEFTGAMANAIWVGTGQKVRLVTPLQWSMKRDIVAAAIGCRAPLQYTYSCYKGEEISCGTCPTCQSRIEAFKVNGIRDPIPYQVDVDWGKCISWKNALDAAG